eukprot:TRINITY_DN1042_c1_g2_i1.p1 TRINITY_DN1042_c1_g2~~TRINITY_DN1042_c1_g2_i1.p1  ORF type:complete len:770 (+),score=130.45 TRINITY_DN1042_c1_g2_i1:76-2385(+)
MAAFIRMRPSPLGLTLLVSAWTMGLAGGEASPVCQSNQAGCSALGGQRVVKDQLLIQKQNVAVRAVASAADDLAGESLYLLSEEANRTAHAVTQLSALQLRDQHLANHIRVFSRDASNVARVIQQGITALIEAVMKFTASPPQVADGIVGLGTQLLKCVELLLPDAETSGKQFLDFKAAWNSAFERIPGAAESIQADIELYIRDGDTPVLIRAIGSIIAEAGALVVSFLPAMTAVEVNKYLNAVVEAFETMGLSWAEFAAGRTVEGIEAIYWGLRSITDSLMPDSIKNNEVYNTIIGALDLVLGNLSKHILEYERRILESNVCWRTEKNRERQRPSQCPDRYVWDGQAECYPTMTASSLIGLNEAKTTADDFYEQFGRGSCRGYDSGHNPSTWYRSVQNFRGSLEQCQALCSADPKCKAVEYKAEWHCELWTTEPQSTAEWSDKSCYKKNGGSMVAGRPVPARCEDDFPEKHGHFCYAQCPGGFQVKDESQSRCLSACIGNFSAESPGMCGRDTGVLTKAILEMVTVILNSAFSLADNIIKMQEHGVNAELLTDTIQIFIDMGKPFANPTCPEWELPTPAPTPAPTPENSAVCLADCTLGTAPGHCRLETGGMTICLAKGAGGCSAGQTDCSAGDAAMPTDITCKMNVPVYVTGHSWNQLQDARGNIGMSPNSQGWEQWAISDAGEGKVFLTSYHHTHLQDHHGWLKASWNKQGWEKWELSPAGNGKVYITSHRGEQLSDSQGRITMSSKKGSSEAWMISDTHGSPACA